MKTAIQIAGDEVGRLESQLRYDVAVSAGALADRHADIRAWRLYLQNTIEGEQAEYAGASLLREPYVKSALLALMAELCPTLLNVEPILHVEGSGVSGAKTADDLERFYQRLLTRTMGAKTACRRWWYDGLRDGSSVVMCPWETRQGLQWGWSMPEMTLDQGTMLPVITSPSAWEQQTVTLYDAPKLTNIDILRFGTLPGQDGDVVESPGIFCRFNLSVADLLDKKRAGAFDARAVARVLSGLPFADATETPEDEAEHIAPETVGQVGNDNDLARNIIQFTEVYQIYRRSASEPWSDWLFTIWEKDGTILRAIPSPYNRRPFFLFRPYHQSKGIHGDSLASVGAGHVQDAKTAITRLAINMMRRRLRSRVFTPQSLYSEMRDKLGPEAFNKFEQDGALIPVPDSYFANASGARIMPLIEGGDPTGCIPLLQYLDEQGQKTTINDTQRGATLPGDVTATEAASVIEGSRRLTGMMIENAAEALGELGAHIHNLCLQYQDSEQVQQVWAREQQSGLPLEQALAGDYEFSANGTSETNIRFIREKRAQEMMQIAANDPITWQNAQKRHRVIMAVLTANPPRNPEAIFGTEEEYVQADQAMQQQQQQQQQLLQAQQAAAQQAAEQEQGLRAQEMAQRGQQEDQRSAVQALGVLAKLGSPVGGSGAV